MRAAIYVRVSTASKTKQADATRFVQNPEVQEQPLRELASQRGWELSRIYSDRASGAAERRPGLDALMADARRGLFQVVVVWRFDRFARSVKQLVLALEEFRSLRIEFVSHQEALDSSTPLGKAMFTIIGAMAELERNIIRERVLAGMEHARRNGTKSGKAVGRPKAVIDRDEVIRLRHEGLSWREIARKLRVGSATVRRVYKEWLASQAALNGDADSSGVQANVVDAAALVQFCGRRCWTISAWSRHSGGRPGRSRSGLPWT